ncbi:MAG: hypothetical protein QW210_01190 [Candidatus Woesearchaeota archaeon]
MKNPFDVKSLDELVLMFRDYKNYDIRTYETEKYSYQISDYDYLIISKKDFKSKHIYFDYYFVLLDQLYQNFMLEINDNEFYLSYNNQKIRLAKPNQVINGLFCFLDDSVLDIFVEDNEYMNSLYKNLTNLISSVKKVSVFDQIDKTIFLKSSTKKNLINVLDELFVLRQVTKKVSILLTYDVVDEKFLSIKYAIDNKDNDKFYVPLDFYIKEGKGICKQFSLLYGYFLEKLIQEKYLPGSFAIDLNYRDFNDLPSGGHMWVRYTSEAGNVFILDNNHIIELFSSKENKSNAYYKRPYEFEEYVKKKIKNV